MSATEPDDVARILVVCPDRPGIVAAVSGFLFEQGANIVDSAQHSTDPTEGMFLMRVEFTLPGLAARRDDLEARFGTDVASRFEMDWELSATRRRPIAILVSRPDHCVVDLLWRHRRDELPAEIVVVISNHPDLAETVRGFDVPFLHVPVGEGGMAAAEEAMLDALDGLVELVVLARYMRILSAGFLERLGVPAINIHHSFLPAFVGADPYRRALERGVKIIGATAHYVTEDLDQGPIIEQDVARVSHRHTLPALEGVGRDIERTVLARAVRWHLEDRVIVHGSKTYVFD
jgi:formyltetrahydrofolate deformylase